MSTAEEKTSSDTKETPEENVKVETQESEIKAEDKNGTVEEAKPAEVASSGATTSATNGETGDEKKDKPLRVRFTGSAKRRYRWLIEQGYEREEAAKLAKSPIRTTELRKMSQGKNVAGPKGLPSKLGLLGKKSIRMAVTTVDFPASTFTNDQANKVKNAILKQMLQQKDANQKPHFQECIFSNGYLLVHCSDAATIKWLQHTVPKLEHWKGPDLKVVSERTLSKSEVFVGIFTESQKDKDQEILDFIECQNEGLSTSKWRIVTRKELPRNKAVELVFTVDPSSSKSLQKAGYELNYKFNKVKLRKKTAESNSGAGRGRGNAQLNRGFNQDRPSFRNSYSNRMSSQSGIQRHGGGFNRSRSPPRQNVWSSGRDRNFDRNRFSGGSSRYGGGSQYAGNSYRSSSSSHSGNSPFASNGAGSAFQSNNNQFPALVDNLYNLVRSATAGGQNALGLNLGQNSLGGNRNSYGSRTGFF